MSASPSHLRPSLLVRFPDAAAANRRVAGMSALGRWAMHARAAGFTAIAVEAPGAQGWPAATRDDLARSGASLCPVQPGAVTLDGRFLLDEAALRTLAEGGRVAALDPAQAIDLTAPGAARAILRATAKPGDGIVSRWLNRPVSQRISALLLHHVPGIRPAHVTGAVALVAVAMLACLLFGGARGLVAGGLLFHLASVLDGVDGEIARAACRGSAAGAALDTRVDMLTNIGFFLSITVALTRLYGGAQAMVGGLVVLFALTGLALVAWLARRSGNGANFDVLKPYYRQRFPGGWQWWVTEILVATTSRDFFAFALAVVIVAGAGWAVSWLLLGFSATWLVAVLCAVPGVLRRTEPALRGI